MGNVTLNGSTSGSITLSPPAVAGTNTLTLPAKTGNIITSADTGTVSQTMLASGVGATGPAFSAYASASQTVTTATITKVAIDTENFDTNSNFDTATNRFTPTVAGYYQVNGSVRGTGTTTFTSMGCYIYKNGLPYKRTQLTTSFTAGNNSQLTVSDIIYMNGSTDYLELFGSVNGTGTLTFTFVSSEQSSYFSACLVRGA